MVADPLHSFRRSLGQGSARSSPRCDGRGVGGQESVGLSLRTDSVDGLGWSDCWSAHRAGSAGSIWRGRAAALVFWGGGGLGGLGGGGGGLRTGDRAAPPGRGGRKTTALGRECGISPGSRREGR